MTITQTKPVFFSISDVERDVGIAKETLRVWERRYAFPRPQRDANGERAYSAEQVHKLTMVKRLLDQGYRPGKIMTLEPAALAELGGKASNGPAACAMDAPHITTCLTLLREHKMTELRLLLTNTIANDGLQRCVVELVAPLTVAVGMAWTQGQLAVFEEHLFADMLQTVLRNAIVEASAAQANAAANAPHHQRQPRVLLTTVPQERHGLGLLMVEALLAVEGAHCTSLGVQTPLAEIVDAVRAQHADIVALSFSGVTSPRAAVDNINDLRARLGEGVEVWAGGAGVAMARRHLPPGTVLDLTSVGSAVQRWRSRQAAGAFAAAQAA